MPERVLAAAIYASPTLVPVSSFSERHAPLPRALGPEIPSGVRRAIASWFREQGVETEDVRRRFFQRRGYGSVDDVAGDIRDRWDEIQSALFYSDLEEDRAVARWSDGDRRRSAATVVSPYHVPAALYLDYLEEAIAKYARDRAIVEVEYADGDEDPFIAPVRYVNGVFAARRIAYRFDDNGRAQWHGDAGAYAEVVRPALDALGDARLAGCLQEFEASLGHLRAGTPKDREDAIEEAGKAVESAMKVVLDECGVPRPERETAEPLWQAIRDGGIVETSTHDAIVSTSRLRNEWGGHGQGGEVREIPDGIPELAVQASAAAIAYLASLLP